MDRNPGPACLVQGGSGHIDGNVVVQNWNSGIQINAVKYFDASEILGLASTASDGGGVV